MPDIPETLRTGFVLRGEIPALAQPPEFVEQADEDKGEPVASVDRPVPGPAAARSDFLTSFSDLSAGNLVRPAPPAQPAQPASGTATRPSAPGRPVSVKDATVLDINYDLVAGPGSVGAVEISKRLRRGDASMGALRLQVDRNAALYASRADLQRMIPSKAAQLDRLDGDYLSLPRLREAGVNLRYDAVRDELVLQD